MPFSFSKTGSTDLRLTDVQQPKTTLTLSCTSSCFAFSAKSGQLDAGSTTTASTLRPSTPPWALISSIAIRVTSRSDTSLIAIVPLSECRMPTLIGSFLSSWAVAPDVASRASARTTPIPLSNFMILPPQSKKHSNRHKSFLELELGAQDEHAELLGPGDRRVRVHQGDPGVVAGH